MNPDYVDSKIIAKVSKRHTPPPPPRPYSNSETEVLYCIYVLCLQRARHSYYFSHENREILLQIEELPQLNEFISLVSNFMR